MKWSEVQQGHVVTVNGERWRVKARDGGAFTLVHPTFGERDGTPNLDAEVDVDPSEREVADVAETLGVATGDVASMHVKLALGGVLIAESRDGDIHCTEEQRMGAKELRVHLHFFHGTFPAEDFTIGQLRDVHASTPAVTKHVHDVPF